MAVASDPVPPPLSVEIVNGLMERAKERGEGKYCILLVVDENNELTWSTLDVTSMVAPAEIA